MGVDRGGWRDADDVSSLTSGLENIHDTISTVPTVVDPSPGVRLPDGMTEEDAVRIYTGYNTRHDYDPALPITKHRQEV